MADELRGVVLVLGDFLGADVIILNSICCLHVLRPLILKLKTYKMNDSLFFLDEFKMIKC